MRVKNVEFLRIDFLHAFDYVYILNDIILKRYKCS